MEMEWPGSLDLDEFEKLVIRLNSPRVVIDNAGCATATLVKIDSARKQRILLEAVQVLTDLNLCIKKGYISSDGKWFMDVFHVTDQYGNKLTDESVISYIEQSLGTYKTVKTNGFTGMTALELTGADRPGLLSEVSAVLADLQCSIVEAKVWTHNGRIGSLIFVKDVDSGSTIEDSEKISEIEGRLKNVLKGDIVVRGARTTGGKADVHIERRLHQMMYADRDYARGGENSVNLPEVTVQDWIRRGYSILNVECKDRRKLLFDVVCTLTDMQYVVFHGTIDTKRDRSSMEFYIRHTDGSPISSEAERQRVIQCVQASIERRVTEGIKLELCTSDRQGLLADVTRTFRENGLNVARAEISTPNGETTRNVFYVTDTAGYAVDTKIIEGVRQRVGVDHLVVKEPQRVRDNDDNTESLGVASAMLLSIGSIVKKNLCSLGLIRS